MVIELYLYIFLLKHRQKRQMAFKKNYTAFRQGFLDALAMPAWVVFASMIGFGSMARDSGISMGIALGSTIGIWGLPGQVAMVELFALSLPYLSIIVASSMANMRFMPMCVIIIPHFRGNRTATRYRFLLAQMLSINTWTTFMRRGPSLETDERLPFFMGIAITCFAGGSIGTTLGFVASDWLPFYLTASLIFLSPAYFVFVFSAVEDRSCILAVALGAMTGPILYKISPDWSVPITGILAGTVSFYTRRFLGEKQ